MKKLRLKCIQKTTTMPGKSAAGFFWEYLDFENIKYKQIKNK